MTEEEALGQIRQKIDALDEQIQGLINARAAAAQDVAKIKQDGGGEAVFYRPEREAQVLRSIKQRNQGPLGDEEMARLFREIMSACLALEHPLRIAFLGPEGTFTQTAALKHFGHSVETLPVGSISDVFQEVEGGNSHYGVVPVENSTEGVISHTLDMFLTSPLQICGEVTLRIHHNLLAVDADLDKITQVFSHQQSLAQCRGWLDRHLPNAERIAVGSNAEAAQRARAEGSGSAAIAGETAGEIYDLQFLVHDIEDEPGNTTRFLIIGKQQTASSGDDKTSLLVTTKNESGGLHRLLQPLAAHGVSMTRIESRPSGRGNWDYVFFIDIDGHLDDARVASALADLQEESGMCRVLGAYPKAVL